MKHTNSIASMGARMVSHHTKIPAARLEGKGQNEAQYLWRENRSASIKTKVINEGCLLIFHINIQYSFIDNRLTYV